MIRVVLDTNVIVSALLKPTGNEAAVFLLALRGTLELDFSEAILAEYEAVLQRPRFKLSSREMESKLAAIRSAGHMVQPTIAITESPDEPDNGFYECAEAAGVAYIVTGNTRHFKKRYGSAKIVTARKLLDILAANRS